MAKHKAVVIVHTGRRLDGTIVRDESFVVEGVTRFDASCEAQRELARRYDGGWNVTIDVR